MSDPVVPFDGGRKVVPFGSRHSGDLYDIHIGYYAHFQVLVFNGGDSVSVSLSGMTPYRSRKDGLRAKPPICGHSAGTSRMYSMKEIVKLATNLQPSCK